MDIASIKFRVAGLEVQLLEMDERLLHSHRLAYMDGHWSRVPAVGPGHVRVLHMTICRGKYRGSRARPALDVLTWDRDTARVKRLFRCILFNNGDYLFDGRNFFMEEDGKMRRVS